MRMKKKSIKCPYCGRTAVLRAASYVYGDRAIERYVYVCPRYPACNSYVGVHENTLLPKGSLANGDLRNKRIKTHKIFDAIWKNGIMTKAEAYRWMQYKFSLTSQQAHIGFFSEYMCDQLIQECEKTLQNNMCLAERVAL